MNKKQFTFYVNDMRCASCAISVENLIQDELGSLEGQLGFEGFEGYLQDLRDVFSVCRI
jgi:hypothetical protein